MIVTSWGITAAERAAAAVRRAGARRGRWCWTGPWTCAAPAAVTFRWLCQLRAAPYSYDLIDNGGRRARGADARAGPARGRAADVPDLHARLVRARVVTHPATDIGAGPAGVRRRGDTYAVRPTGPATSRILARVRTRRARPGPARALGWGDLIMIRKQLRTFAALAAATAA